MKMNDMKGSNYNPPMLVGTHTHTHTIGIHTCTYLIELAPVLIECAAGSK